MAGLGLGLVATFAPLPVPAASAATFFGIDPTSGPIGTTITATVTGCTGANNDGTAQLDFQFEGLSPSATKTFTPAASGATTVTIQATEKVGQSETKTVASVILSQCVGVSASSVAFTVTRGATTSSSSTSSSSTSSSSTSTSSTSTSTTATTAPTTSTTAAPTVGLGGVDDATVTPGQVVNIGGDGFAAGAQLTVTLRSLPISITTITANATGGYAAQITIPLGAPPGDHNIVVSGQGGTGGIRETRAPVNVKNMNCEDFTTRQAAQRILDADRADPHDLDRDNDGMACDGLADGGLARTGSSTLPLTVGGILLIGFGTLAMAQRKRRLTA